MKEKMRRGESAKHFAEKFDNETPEIIIVKGASPYIWVGGSKGPCYATLSGNATLRKLANNIIALTEKPKSTKARE